MAIKNYIWISVAEHEVGTKMNEILLSRRLIKYAIRLKNMP